MKHLETFINSLQARLNNVGNKLNKIKAEAEQNNQERLKMMEDWKNNENAPVGVVDDNGIFRIKNSLQ